MHEWALAESVIKKASEQAALDNFAAISEVGVALGELQAIDREIFAFALKELVKSSFKGLSACKFNLQEIPAVFKCKVCAREFTLSELKRTDSEAENIHFIPEMAHAFLKCPACMSPDFDVTSGRGVALSHITGEKRKNDKP